MARCFVTGASGLLGTNLVLALRQAGHEVSILARTRASVDVVCAAAPGVTVVDGDLDAVDVLAKAAATHDVFFHSAAAVSILKAPTPALVRANVTGTENVLAAMKAAKSTRLVYVSSTVCIGLAKDSANDADETSTWDLPQHGLADGYATTKKQAEERVQAALGDVDAVIVNPGYLFGPYDAKPSSGKLIREIALRKLPGSTPGINNFVDARDVARGLVLAWQKGKRGERYILGGHNLRYTELVPLVARLAGVKPPSLRAPFALAYAVGMLGDVQAQLTGQEPLVTTAAARWSFCDRFRMSSEKAKRELGYTISPLEGAITDCLSWFKATGRLRG